MRAQGTVTKETLHTCVDKLVGQCDADNLGLIVNCNEKLLILLWLIKGSHTRGHAARHDALVEAFGQRRREHHGGLVLGNIPIPKPSRPDHSGRWIWVRE